MYIEKPVFFNEIHENDSAHMKCVHRYIISQTLLHYRTGVRYYIISQQTLHYRAANLLPCRAASVLHYRVILYIWQLLHYLGKMIALTGDTLLVVTGGVNS